MGAFEYVALDSRGKRTRGVVAADTARAARKELRARSLTLVELTPAKERGEDTPRRLPIPLPRLGGGLREKERVLATRQLAVLIEAGAPVEEALNIVAQQTERRPARAALLQVRAQVLEGRRFAEALNAAGGAFDPLYRAMVAAGEGSGRLGVVLKRLADHLEQSRAMRRKITAAMAYPVVIALVAAATVTALMVFVVPRVVEQFSTFDQDLPLLTRALIAVSGFLADYGVVLLGALVAGGIAFAAALQTPPVRMAVDRVLLAAPLIGGAIRLVDGARFARTAATLIASGAPALDAIAAARNTIGNTALQAAAKRMAGDVREGAAVSAAMQRTGAFPPLLGHLAAAGERGGALDQMFDTGADYLEAEFENASGLALSLLEPLVIVVMGGIVATIVLAIMLPILQLNTMALL